MEIKCELIEKQTRQRSSSPFFVTRLGLSYFISILDGPGMSLELGKWCVDRYPSTDAAGEKTPTAILADIFQGTEFNRNSAFGKKML